MEAVMNAQIVSLTERRQMNAEEAWISVRSLFSSHHLYAASIPDYVAEAWSLVIIVAELRIESNRQPYITYEELTMCFRDAKRFEPFGY
jgi:hypothetical protein